MSETGLFYRMTTSMNSDAMYSEETYRTVSIDNMDNIQVTVLGDVQSTTVFAPVNSSYENIDFIRGADIIARLSELSITIEHDEKYTGDYMKLYSLMTTIVTKM